MNNQLKIITYKIRKITYFDTGDLAKTVIQIKY